MTESSQTCSFEWGVQSFVHVVNLSTLVNILGSTVK